MDCIAVEADYLHWHCSVMSLSSQHTCQSASLPSANSDDVRFDKTLSRYPTSHSSELARLRSRPYSHINTLLASPHGAPQNRGLSATAPRGYSTHKDSLFAIFPPDQHRRIRPPPAQTLVYSCDSATYSTVYKLSLYSIVVIKGAAST